MSAEMEQNMIIERDVPIRMDDGIELRADIFKPAHSDRFPVLISLSPYGKGFEWKKGWASSWQSFWAKHPNALTGSTHSHLIWECVDPEVWTALGYAIVRIDSRGAGRSPGVLDVFGPREVEDFYHAIEWAGTQPWSNGNVGIAGISYLAMNQWLVASLQPPHLKAMIAWEGSADYYRDTARHGGILSNGFLRAWYDKQVILLQHGNPKGPEDPWLGTRSTGPLNLSEEELKKNRMDAVDVPLQMEWDGEWYRKRSPVWSKVTVPFVSAANWGGMGLHQRGNFAAFEEAASTEKWLEIHSGKHEEGFYLDYALELQKKFFDHYLKGVSNGWEKEKRVRMKIRRPFTEDFQERRADVWPLPQVKWTQLFLSAATTALLWEPASKDGQATFDALGAPLIFQSQPLAQETEITGPLAAKLFISSTTTDVDLFLTFQAFSPSGEEVEFQGSHDPHTPLAQGWLRASHRKLDPDRSKPHRPFHTHDEQWPLEPGKVTEVQIEIWQTNIVLPAGYTLALQIGGHDFERGKPVIIGERVNDGVGPFRHTHPVDRPTDKFGGKTTIHTGGEHDSHLLLPLVPV
ncbi:hypothetical protein PV08_09024 [Exophiala spinifera]|uniref:Xaa-Pro dipeptidyl-peptidase C-terminal domain-containing protein n=1 Tax=Exophiala spinifera TaxID=91928 RepID=A0A0D1ZFH5_9EURO|nr:uncharacterized protein PV08_09024 [Exophiala spinifera]KIW11752.1 hypothetical protein PV08_09024 [Exophiala spinifera]